MRTIKVLRNFRRLLWNRWMTFRKGEFYACRNVDCLWTGWESEASTRRSEPAYPIVVVCPKCRTGGISRHEPMTKRERVAYRLSGGLEKMTEAQRRIYCEVRGIDPDA